MYKLLLVLVALAVCVFAAETQDQEAAEQYFAKFGYYPSWYNAYTYSAGYPYTAGYAAPYSAYAAPYAYSGYKAAYPYSPYGYKYVY